MSAASAQRRPAFIGVLSLAFLAAGVARAQWSSDPSDNLIVSNLQGGTTQPKIAPTRDGGFYVSWLGNDADGYDLWLQRIDADGNPLWAANGILIADRAYPLVIDYGLCTDADDDAFLAYSCCTYTAPSEVITLSKILPDGTRAWNGVASLSDRSVLNAYCTVGDDGDVVAAWSQDGGVHGQKFDAGGNPQWVLGGVIASTTTGVNLVAHVGAGTAGDVIVSWNNISGTNRALFAQKLDSADGSARWNGGMPRRVFGAGSLETSFYPFDPDGSGGAVFWDYDTSGAHDVPRVQHLAADGTAMFGANGVIATADTTIDHTDTYAWFNAATGDTYVVWRDARDDGPQPAEGVSAQRIDAAGALQWGDNGRVLAPLVDSDDADAISQLIALPAPDGFVASWVVGVTPAPDQPLRAMYVDTDGNAAWASMTVDAKTTRYTSHAVGAVSTMGFLAYAWSDGDEASGISTIRAQNINLDGSLGMAPPEDVIFRDGFDGS